MRHLLILHDSSVDHCTSCDAEVCWGLHVRFGRCMLFLVLLVFVFSRGWFLLRSASQGSFPPWRVAAFVTGLFSLWIALGSPLAALDHQLLTIHMMKHLLLMVVGAPLILLGAPTLPLLCGLPKYFMRRSLLLRKTPRLLGHFLSTLFSAGSRVRPQ